MKEKVVSPAQFYRVNGSGNTLKRHAVLRPGYLVAGRGSLLSLLAMISFSACAPCGGEAPEPEQGSGVAVSDGDAAAVLEGSAVEPVPVLQTVQGRRFTQAISDCVSAGTLLVCRSADRMQVLVYDDSSEPVLVRPSAFAVHRLMVLDEQHVLVRPEAGNAVTLVRSVENTVSAYDDMLTGELVDAVVLGDGAVAGVVRSETAAQLRILFDATGEQALRDQASLPAIDLALSPAGAVVLPGRVVVVASFRERRLDFYEVQPDQIQPKGSAEVPFRPTALHRLPDGRLLALPATGTQAAILQAEPGAEAQLVEMPAIPTMVRFHGESLFAWSAGESSLIQANLQGEAMQELVSRASISGTVRTLVVSDDGELAWTLTDDGTISVWQTKPLALRDAVSVPGAICLHAIADSTSRAMPQVVTAEGLLTLEYGVAVER
jgi:hypothetical protein